MLERQLNKLSDDVFKFALASLVTEIEMFKGQKNHVFSAPGAWGVVGCGMRSLYVFSS